MGTTVNCPIYYAAALMYVCQLKGCKMGQSSGVLLKEVAVFQKCPLMKVSLCIII